MWHVWLFSFCPLSPGPDQGFFPFKRSFSCQCWLFRAQAWVSVKHLMLYDKSYIYLNWLFIIIYYLVTVPQDWSTWGNGSAGSVFPFKLVFIVNPALLSLELCLFWSVVIEGLLLFCCLVLINAVLCMCKALISAFPSIIAMIKLNHFGIVLV